MTDKTNDKCPIQVARTMYIGTPLPNEVPLALPVQVHAVAGHHRLTIEQARYLASELLAAADDAQFRRVAKHEFTPRRSNSIFSGPADETCDRCGCDPRNEVHA